jgi:hypothetical protein
MDKIEQRFDNSMKRSRSESGERVRHSEISDSHNGSQSRPLDMRGLLERKRELDRESDPHRAEAVEHEKLSGAGVVDKLNKERASGELVLKSETQVKKQVDDMRLDREYVNGLLERQRIIDQHKK